MALQKHFSNYEQNIFHSTEQFMEDDKSTSANIAISFRYKDISAAPSIHINNKVSKHGGS